MYISSIPFVTNNLIVYRKIGFDCYLIDLVEGPPTILKHLCNLVKLHMIPVAFSSRHVDRDILGQYHHIISAYFIGELLFKIFVVWFVKGCDNCPYLNLLFRHWPLSWNLLINFGGNCFTSYTMATGIRPWSKRYWFWFEVECLKNNSWSCAVVLCFVAP